MKQKQLSRILRGILLAGTPFALNGCGFSSCPDKGYQGPMVTSKKVAADFANGGSLDAQQCAEVCTDGEHVVTCVRESAESVLCLNDRFPCEGRRPAGLQGPARRPGGAFARHVADAAWLEAASVVAFRNLRHELKSHGAPKRLLRAASRSARDERRHARSSKALARRFGVPVPDVRHRPPGARSLLDIALENAVEGCVRETWGALMALRQAKYAAEPAVRTTMLRIAPDEARHAALAWQVADWLTPRLSGSERQEVLAARASALAALRREVTLVSDPSAQLRLGLPGAEEGAALLDAFADALTTTTTPPSRAALPPAAQRPLLSR